MSEPLSEVEVPPADLESRPVPSPRDSEDYQAVRSAFVRLGHQGSSWDSLCFSFGFHPTLHGHHLAIERLPLLLTLPPFTGTSAKSCGRWQDDGAAWSALLRDWPKVLGLVDPTLRLRLDPPRKPKANGSGAGHPIQRHGVVVAPLPTVLVVTHLWETSGAEDLQDAALRFKHLQSMLAAAFAHMRHLSGLRVEEYLTHAPDPSKEFHPIPIRAGEACRALRWLSEPAQLLMTLDLPLASGAEAYLQGLQDWRGRMHRSLDTPAFDFTGTALNKAHDHPARLCSYLGHWIDVIRSGDAASVRRARSRGGSSPDADRKPVDGFVPATLEPIPVASWQQSAAHAGDSNQSLAPTDLETRELVLVSASDIRQVLSRQRFAAMHAAMAETAWVWDRHHLPPSLVRTFVHSALGDLERCPVEALDLDCPSLLLMLMASLGQPLDRIERLDAVLCPAAEDGGDAAMPSLLELEIANLTLVVSPSQTRDPPQALGFLVPAVEPRLALDRAGMRQTVRNLLVPAGRLGTVLASRAVWKSGSQGRASSWNAPIRVPAFLVPDRQHTAEAGPSDARRREDQFLECWAHHTGGARRGTDALLRQLPRHLGDHIETTTDDPTLRWLLTWDTDRVGEARLYYTQHRIERLWEVWHVAAVSAGLVDPRQASVPEPLGLGTSCGSARVGAPFVAPLPDVQRLVDCLRRRLRRPLDADRRSQITAHHHDMVVYLLLLQGMCLSLRAVREPVGPLRALEFTDRLQDMAKQPVSNVGELRVMFGAADKETYYDQRARLVRLPEVLIQQLRAFESHRAQVVRQLSLADSIARLPATTQALFRFNERGDPVVVDMAWYESKLAALGWPWPANFPRAFLRTQMLERGGSSGDVDALLGHQDRSGGSTDVHSAYDQFQAQVRLGDHLDALQAAIGLQVEPGRLGSRLESARLPLDRPTLGDLHAVGPFGRGRSSRVRHIKAPGDLSAFWDAVHQRASPDDRRHLRALCRWLRLQAANGNGAAQCLVAADPIAWAMARIQHQAGVRQSDLALARAMLALRARLKLLIDRSRRRRLAAAASWFRLLARASERMRQGGIDLPTPVFVAFDRRPSSPFTERNVLGLPLVQAWVQALARWSEMALALPHANPSAPPDELPKGIFDVEAWATALLMSAVLNGMLLDRTKLQLILERFSNDRRLEVSGPYLRASLDFDVAGTSSVQRQCQRWWLDPLSELIWLHAPAAPSELRLGDLHPWLRRITSLHLPLGVDARLEPQSFSDLIRCAEIAWLTRSSRDVVAMQRRHIDGSSLAPDCWRRMVNTAVLMPPSALRHAEGDGKPIGHRDAEQAATPTRQESEKSGDWVHEQEIDEDHLESCRVSAPWLESLIEHVQHAQDDPSTLERARLTEAMPVADSHGERELSHLMVDFAVWLGDGGAGTLRGPALLRTVTAAGQLMLQGVGLGWTDTTSTPSPDLVKQGLETLREAPMGVGATRKSLSEAGGRLLAFLAQRSGTSVAHERAEGRGEGPHDGDPDEDEDEDDDEDHRARVDARVISHDECSRALQRLQELRFDPEHAEDASNAATMIMLTFYLGLRPPEVRGLRLADVDDHAVWVTPYNGYKLKTPNAERRCPLSPLMPRPVIGWLLKRREKRMVAAGEDQARLIPDDTEARRGRSPSHQKLANRVLREVTGSDKVRLYTCRHSCGTWLDLALRSIDLPEIPGWFVAHPKTQAFLTSGRAVADVLMGGEAARLGRSSYLLARWLGHAGPAISRRHYLNTNDLIADATCRRHVQSIPAKQWRNWTGRSTKEGLDALLADARKALGWKVQNAQDAGQASDHTGGLRGRRVHACTQSDGGSPWLGLSVLIDLVRWASHLDITDPDAPAVQRKAQQVGRDGPELLALVERLRATLGKTMQPGRAGEEAISGGQLLTRLSQEVDAHSQRIEAWMASERQRDADALQRSLSRLLETYSRRDRDFQTAKHDALAGLGACFEALGLSPTDVRVTRRVADLKAHVAGTPPPESPACLGAYLHSEVQISGCRDQQKAASIVKRIGLRPVDSAGQGWGHALAIMAALGLAQLEAARLDHQPPSAAHPDLTAD